MRITKTGRYHHGDLRAALIDTAIELIGERGVQGFSLAEASRRLGVTVAAPYKHFADRDGLLAAIAVCGPASNLPQRPAETSNAVTAADQLAAAARGYVRCAAANRALFQALFGGWPGQEPSPRDRPGCRLVADAFLTPAHTICGHADDAYDLTLAVVAAAHGHATLLLDWAFGHGQEAVDAATRRAASVTHAMVQGRHALRQPTGPRSDETQ